MDDHTQISAHLILKGKAPRPSFDELVHLDPESKPVRQTVVRAKECVERTGLTVHRVGEWELFVTGSVDEFEKVFSSRIVTVDGDILFSSEPTIPKEWRDVVSDVILPPPVRLTL